MADEPSRTVPAYSVDWLHAEIDRLREKNRELNRRAQEAASDARKAYAREIGNGMDHLSAWRIAKLLDVDPAGKSFATLADETEAAMRERLAENAALRHALQVAHDWMGRSPDNDCDEGGGFGAAHLATAERAVIAALNGDCEERTAREPLP